MTEPRPPDAHGGEPLPEGEEAAPPGTRAMGIVRWSIVGLMALAAAGAWTHYATSSGVLSAAERYHCPMHPTVVGLQRGECPICGMDLVLVAHRPGDDGGRAATDAPDAAAAAAGHAGHAPAPPPADGAGPLYECPMKCDPAFVTPDPKARCPRCGMKLAPVAPAAGAHAAAAPEGVPGLAPVDLTVDRIQLMGMRTVAARRAPLAASLRTVGFVTAPESGLVSVTTRFTGWIEALGASETGQRVEKGQVLATIYSPEMVNAQQVFLNAIRWSERREGPGGAPGAAPATAPALVSDLERDARQRLELLGVAPEDVDAIARTGKAPSSVSVRSPVRGYVARKSALRGLYVQPGTELFQIADLSRMWVLADVYESEIGRVAVGQKATLEVAAWPGELFSGRVTFIYPAVNTGSRTLQARLEFPNPGLRLRPGMYGDVTLEVGARDAVVVPREALVDTGELQYLFVARGGGRFEPRRVRVGPGGDGQVAILSGLAEGETVVTTAAFLLDSESRLRAALAPAD